jgi:putative component of membrane protein insertase Oxa1/YidC/SpoIIIJ protein YidD
LGYGSQTLISTSSAIIRHALISCMRSASRIKMISRFDRPVRSVTIVFIQAYRAFLSPWLGQHCLFSPSCSTRAIFALQHLTWNEALHKINAQTQRCCGNYIVRYSPDGELELQASDGMIFHEAELSSLVAARCQHFVGASKDRSSWRRGIV